MPLSPSGPVDIPRPNSIVPLVENEIRSPGCTIRPVSGSSGCSPPTRTVAVGCPLPLPRPLPKPRPRPLFPATDSLLLPPPNTRRAGGPLRYKRAMSPAL